jgi:molybdenum cofactor guanylyltransferase
MIFCGMMGYFRVTEASDARSSSREAEIFARLLSCTWKHERGKRLHRVDGFRAVYHRRMTGASPDVTAFILAGGKSLRMGVDKAFVRLDGQTLLARMLDVATAVTADVHIVGAASKFAAFAPVVEDVFQGCGPLAAIHAALSSSTAELNLMLAVDVPFVTPPLLKFLLARAAQSKAIVTVPRTNGRWQPLCAVYRREFGGLADSALSQRRYKIDALFDPVWTLTVEEEELATSGFGADMFRNLNTPKDVESAERKS